MEFLVHLNADDLPKGLVAIPASILEEVAIERVEIEQLPRNWRRFPFPKSLQAIGAKWLASGESVVLSVPLAVVPTERNLLLNPAHPDFAAILREPAIPFALDARLRKG